MIIRKKVAINPYREDNIFLSLNKDDAYVLSLLGVNYDIISETPDKIQITVTVNIVDFINELTNEQLWDVLHSIVLAIQDNYNSFSSKFIIDKITEILTVLSEQFATKFENRVFEMVPDVVESEYSKISDPSFEVLINIDDASILNGLL